MNPRDADWWWGYGLDGIVAGVVGGLVTALAVWWTLTHERRMASRLAAQEQAARVQPATHRFLRTIEFKDAATHDLELENETWLDLYATVAILIARMGRLWPRSAQSLTDLLDTAHERFLSVKGPWPAADTADMRKVLGAVSSTAGYWLMLAPRADPFWARWRARRKDFAEWKSIMEDLPD